MQVAPKTHAAPTMSPVVEYKGGERRPIGRRTAAGRAFALRDTANEERIQRLNGMSKRHPSTCNRPIVRSIYVSLLPGLPLQYAKQTKKRYWTERVCERIGLLEVDLCSAEHKFYIKLKRHPGAGQWRHCFTCYGLQAPHIALPLT